MKNFTRRVCGLLAGITALSAIQMTTVLASATESSDGSMQPEKKEAIVEIVEKTVDEVVEKTADEAAFETDSQDLALSIPGEKAELMAASYSSNGAVAGTAAWAPGTAWNTINNSATYVCGTIKCHTRNASGAKTFTNKTLLTKSGWVDAEDEITIKKIDQNGVGTWYAIISYPTSSGTKTAFIPLSSLSCNCEAQAGVEKRARVSFRGIYCRPGERYPGEGYISEDDAVYVIGKSGDYTQVLYPTGSNTGECPAKGDNTWKLAWIKTTDARKYLVSKQIDSSWSNYDYGYDGNGNKANIGGSGCALMALVNAVYYLNGNMIAPESLADFALGNNSTGTNYRPSGEGTSWGFPKAFCDEKGSLSNIWIRFVERADNNPATLRERLKEGCVATAGAPGHLIAVVAYDASNDKYLVFDSDTNTHGIWVSEYNLWHEYNGGGIGPVWVIGKR